MLFFTQMICIGIGCAVGAMLLALNMTADEAGGQDVSSGSNGREAGNGKRQRIGLIKPVNICNGKTNKEVRFSRQVLDDIRSNAGRYSAETGGLLASAVDQTLIDRCCFDVHSKNTPGTFYYDVESMSAVFRAWKAKGYTTNGIYHSHPRGCIQPSYHDISTVLMHIRFLKLEYFYLPILQPERRGLFQMYFYVVRADGDKLTVTLEYVLRAKENGYVYAPFTAWEHVYSVQELDDYRRSIDYREPAKEPAKEAAKGPAKEAAKEARVRTAVPVSEYFRKVRSLYPESVLDKAIVCIGTGGARSFLVNLARCGFRNFILMDADVVSPSNIATQGVFISEMGRYKVDVIRERIEDINPEAKVICVHGFLDDTVSDEDFKHCLDLIPDKKPTDYLILGCTDNFEAQKRSSLLALKYGTPYLAAMMYEAGAAAEIIFVYPGVTESCPRCLLRERFEKYEHGFQNDVTSAECPIFATEYMNAVKGYIAIMLMSYHEGAECPFSTMLDEVKDRNFVEIRLNPHLRDSSLGISLFDRVFAGASRYTYMGETIWVPQHPDRPEFGSEPCRLCGGTGDLKRLQTEWSDVDTRTIDFSEKAAGDAQSDSPPLRAAARRS